MRLLSEDQVRSAFNVDDVIRAIRAAFTRGFATVRMPVRTVLELDGAILLIMPCYDTAAARRRSQACKREREGWCSCRLTNCSIPATGIPVARMEANYLTDLRTAATSAVATDLLARKDAETLGIFGSGRAGVGASCRASSRSELQAISGLRIRPL